MTGPDDADVLDCQLERFAEVAYAALLDSGRPDLALLVHAFPDDDGEPYLEFDADEMDDTDARLMVHAQHLARVVTR